MLLTPRREDLALVGFELGRLLRVVGAAQLAFVLVAAGLREWNALTALALGGGASTVLGTVAVSRLRTRRPLDWSHGIIVAAAGWVVAAAVGAIPIYLSGHVRGYLEAVFEAMSGLTGTGLSLLEDLDHLPLSINLWRHVLQVGGGFAFVVIAVTILTAGLGGGRRSVRGDRAADRVLPNLSRTARSLGIVAAGLVVAGLVATLIAVLVAGIAPLASLAHAVALTSSALSTGAFSLRSASVGYYHSWSVELVVMALMLAGATSFAVHQHLRRGEWRPVLRRLEVRTAIVMLVLLGVTTLVGLGRSGTFLDVVPLGRTGIFTLVSAATTTGLTVVPTRLLSTDWGLIAPAALVAAMAIGGMSASPAGGIKMLRVGLVWKGVVRDIRRVLLPESALLVETYDHERRIVLSDSDVRATATVLLLYLGTYLTGGMVILFAGEGSDLTAALLESTAATSNTGLSVGVLRPDAPAVLKLVPLVQMWLGRLEFLAAFALIGWLVSLPGGRT